LGSLLTVGLLSYKSLANPEPGVEGARISQSLLAERTFGFGGVESPHAILLSIHDMAKSILLDAEIKLPPQVKQMFDPQFRTATLGFDPITAEGWQSIGINSDSGMFVVGDTILSKRYKRPLIFFKLESREKLMALNKRFGNALSVGEKQGNNEIVRVGKKALFLMGDRGDHTVLMPIKQSKIKAQRTDFDDYLAAAGPTVASHAELAKVTEGPAVNGRLLGALNLKSLAAALRGRSPMPPEDLAFYTDLFRAFGGTISDNGIHGRLVASKAGHAALEKLFGAKGAPGLTKFMPTKGWFALRLSINFQQIFEGISDLIPPSKAQVRAMLPMAQLSIASKLGFPFDTLAKAFSGHFMMGADVTSLLQMKIPGKAKDIRAMVTMGVKDTTAADQVIAQLIAKLQSAARGPAGKPTPITVGDANGYQWNLGPIKPILVRVGQTVFFGANMATVNEAVARSTGENFSSTAGGKDLERPKVIYGSTFDLSNWVGGLEQYAGAFMGGSPAGAKGAEFKALLAKAKKFLQGGNTAVAISMVLDQGLKVSMNGRGGLVAAAGVVAAVAIPAFVKYQKRAKSSEASYNLRKIFDGQLAYFESKNTQAGNEKTPLFASSVPLTPGNPTTYMCKDGKSVRYQPTADTFKHPTWQALNFALADPFYYAYEVETKGTGNGTHFTVRAMGDLDCDGVLSTFERIGTLDEAGNLSGGVSIYQNNPLE
jgi:hypothetical protein